MKAADVFSGKLLWSIECADVLQWAKSLPDDSINLLVTSPPYEAKRTYGIGFKLRGEDWVAWMVDVVRAFVPKVKGLIAINCEGSTDEFQYSATPFLLAADLHRLGFNLRKPIVFHRIGIPGSGGAKAQHEANGGSADWLRNDWEPVICISRPGKLPWADALAMGHPPKWAPGGEMSHRLTDGKKRNQWGGCSVSPHERTADGERQSSQRPSHVVVTKSVTRRKANGSSREPASGTATSGTKDGDTQTIDGIYVPPAIANPGNVLQLKVGGGMMGSGLAHKNEAPFPIGLPEFFVRSFCPEGGIVCDPFSGSGTTAHASIKWGRRFVGCDVRQSQVDLGIRRVKDEAENLFQDCGEAKGGE